MSEHVHTPCACTTSGGQLVRPCLTHYGELSETDRRRVRAQLGLGGKAVLPPHLRRERS